MKKYISNIITFIFSIAAIIISIWTLCDSNKKWELLNKGEISIDVNTFNWTKFESNTANSIDWGYDRLIYNLYIDHSPTDVKNLKSVLIVKDKNKNKIYPGTRYYQTRREAEKVYDSIINTETVNIGIYKCFKMMIDLTNIGNTSILLKNSAIDFKFGENDDYLTLGEESTSVNLLKTNSTNIKKDFCVPINSVWPDSIYFKFEFTYDNVVGVTDTVEFKLLYQPKKGGDWLYY